MNYVFIRGLARNKNHWYGFEKLFSKKSHIIMLDIPGNGEFYHLTSKTNITENTEILRNQFLHNKKDEKYTLIGISLGGMIALDWLSRFENDFEHFVIINSSAKNLAYPWQRFNLNMAINIPILMFSSDENIEKTILGQTLNLRKVNSELIQKAMELMSFKTSKINFFKQIYSAANFNFPKNVNGKKLFIIYSLNDRLVNSISSRKMIQLTHCQFAVHPSAGHDLPLDDPKWLYKVICDLENV